MFDLSTIEHYQDTSQSIDTQKHLNLRQISCLMAFKEFLGNLHNVMQSYNYQVSDIDYINLDSVYSVEPHCFFELDDFPSVVADKFAKVSWCNAWYVPHDFQVVLTNGTIFMYRTTSDEYYSSWVCIEPPKRSPIAITK